jgi:saccharopine dehydrogenase-like NADP-dependent oxidoreductase
VYGQTVNGEPRSAIQITTAGGICTVLDMLAKGKLPQRGFVKQEEIGLEPFLENRFGRVYATNAPLTMEIPEHMNEVRNVSGAGRH